MARTSSGAEETAAVAAAEAVSTAVVAAEAVSTAVVAAEAVEEELEGDREGERRCD